MLRVLLVEDDVSTRALVTRVLKAYGHQVTALSFQSRGGHVRLDPEVAWRDHDLIILDVAMPGKSGDERMMEHVHGWSDKDKKRVNVVLFSAIPAHLLLQIMDTLQQAGLENVTILEKGQGLVALIDMIERIVNS